MDEIASLQAGQGGGSSGGSSGGRKPKLPPALFKDLPKDPVAPWSHKFPSFPAFGALASGGDPHGLPATRGWDVTVRTGITQTI